MYWVFYAFWPKSQQRPSMSNVYCQTYTTLANHSSGRLLLSRAVAITAISQYRAIDEHNRRGMQQPRYSFFFFGRLRPSRFILSAYVLNISNDNNVYHADLYRGSVNLHLTSLNRQRMREIDWARAITWVCPSGRVMYICENRLLCPRKAKSVLASTLCWSAEPLKVALKVKMISTACFITYLEWISVFERVFEWMKTHS